MFINFTNPSNTIYVSNSFTEGIFVILMKEESHYNSNISEYKMQFVFVESEPENANRRSNDKNTIILVN